MNIIAFDLETTIAPNEIIEFGAIILDSDSRKERSRYETFVHSNKVTKRSIDCNGITQAQLTHAPHFKDLADHIYNMMHGHIWLGHNIRTFDIRMINNAYARINKPAPQPHSTIDTLPLLRAHLKGECSSFALAHLGKKYGLGIEQHRSISDVEMTLAVIDKSGLPW